MTIVYEREDNDGDRMSLSLPDDIVSFLDLPSGFCAMVKTEHEKNICLLGSKEDFFVSLLCG